MQQPRLSIIIPTLNEAQIIQALLENLLLLPGVEIVVSDGGSTDGTVKICAGLRITLIDGPAGRGRQLNRGAEAAQGKILLFLHADSQLEPQVVEQIIAAVDNGHLWGCAQLAFDDPSVFFRRLAYFSNLRSRWLSVCYGDQAIFCQKDFFIKKGRFPEIIFLEDMAFSHLLRRQQKAWVVPGKVISSARRFQAGGPHKTLFKMQLIKILYLLGVSPQRLYAIYR